MPAKNKKEDPLRTGEAAVRKVINKRSSPLASVWGFIMWIVGILVSLAVGFGMADQVLTIKFVPIVITVLAGWVVVVLILLGVLLKIIDKLSEI